MPLVSMAKHREPKLQMNAAGLPPLISAGNPRPPPPSWVKLPPLTQAEQGENGGFDNDSPLPQNRGHAADHVRRFRGLRKIDAGETARRPARKMPDRSGGFFRAPRGPERRKKFAFSPPSSREKYHYSRKPNVPLFGEPRPPPARD